MRERDREDSTLDPLMELLKDFLDESRSCLNKLLEELKLKESSDLYYTFSVMHKGGRSEINFDGSHFFLRTSTEYSSPQLTIEEAQGIIVARLLEGCGNYLESKGDKSLDEKAFPEILESLRKPPKGKIVPFLLNSDDVEPDRYSNNPLKSSIVDSGQSAFPASTVKTSGLDIDKNFVSKYEGSLITREEVDFIKHHLHDMERYVDFIEFVKNDALERLSEKLGIDLCLPTLRMPLEMLKEESKSDPLHLVIQSSHKDYKSIATVYRLMGRSIKKKTTLLTVPHSSKGFGSKRAAKGRFIFDGDMLKQVDVRFRNVKLYPNMVDPKDISQAKADDVLSIKRQDLQSYNYLKTPSSPQFVLYTILSPENASISHGVGAYAGSEILKSYCSVYEAFVRNIILEDVPRRNSQKRTPLPLNLVPEKMWIHPEYRNIDASIGCTIDPVDLFKRGMAIECLDYQQEVDSRLFK